MTISINPAEFLILVVDDINQNLQVIGEMLEQAGYETTFAISGQQALERVQAAQPDLILLDLMMPGMNGLEVCQRLKANPDFCQIPIIFLTASNEQDDVLQAFKKGAADYITKPFRPEEVLARIETQLTNQNLKKQLEQQNRQLQAEVEVRRLTEAALQQALDAAEAANRAKSTFLANMSHELRTPLNAILGFTQLLSHSSNLNREEQKNLDIVRRSGEHLLSLINDILDLSKIEAGRITVNETDFNLIEMLLELEEIFRFKANQKGLRLEVILAPNVPHFIKSDRLKLRQVLINLLANAIKFTKFGSIKLQVLSFASQELNLICFEISDTGIGIATDEIKNLFQPFVQTEAGITSAEGTGLGLAISRKYVQLLGGDIIVSSRLGEGTAFKFQIAVTVVEEKLIQSLPRIRRPIALEPNQPAYRILVVDDKLNNRQLLMQMLSEVGFHVQEAANGQEAIEIWENFQPHLIYMDMRMPLMDGYEATKKIKSSLKGQATAIIALTASAFQEEKGIILSAGCDDIAYKPFQESVIFDKIAQHLGARYIYEESKPPQVNNSELFQNLSGLEGLPKSLFAQLEKAALDLDEEALYEVLDRISPQQMGLAEALRIYIDNFEYHKILEAIEAAKIDKFPQPKLSPEWAAQIKQAIRKADLDLMDSLIVQLKNENAILAQLMQSYLDNFEYHNILNLIKEIEEKENFEKI